MIGKEQKSVLFIIMEIRGYRPLWGILQQKSFPIGKGERASAVRGGRVSMAKQRPPLFFAI